MFNFTNKLKRTWKSNFMAFLLNKILIPLLLLWAITSEHASASVLESGLLLINHSTDSIDPSDQKDDSNLSLQKIQAIMDSAILLRDSEIDKSIFYAEQVLESDELQNSYNLRVEAYLNLGWAYRKKKSYDLAISNFSQAMAISDANNDTTQLLNSYRGLGSTYRSAGKTRISINYLERILDYEKTFKDQYFIASTMASIQSRYKDLAEYEKALDYGFKSLNIREKMGSQRRIGSSYLDIANIYRHLDDYDKALLYTKMAEKNYTAINHGLDRVYNQYGLINLNQGNNQEAIKYFQMAYDLNQANNDIEGMGRELGNLGVSYRKLRQYDKSLEYQMAALDLKKEANSIMYMSNSYSGISRIHFYLKDYSQAKLYLDTAIQFSTELELNSRLMSNYWSYSDLYNEMGDHKSALEYYVLYAKLKDSIYSEQNQEKIAEMAALYELDKKESENEILRKDNEFQNLEILWQRNVRNFFIILSSLVVILIFVLYNRYIGKKKSNVSLFKYNEQISKQKLELIESNATKDKFFSIIAHDLKSPFNSILGFSELLDESYDDYSDNERKKMIGLLTKTSKHSFLLLQNLLTWARSQRGAIEINLENIPLHKLIFEAISSYLGAASLKKIDVIVDVEEDNMVHVDNETMRTVIANVVSNAIKYTEIGGKIIIRAEIGTKDVILSIKDDGMGMSQETIDKLFRIEESFSIPGTANEKGTGLGLIICKEFVDKNDGKIWAESEEGVGTTFKIKMPKGLLST